MRAERLTCIVSLTALVVIIINVDRMGDRGAEPAPLQTTNTVVVVYQAQAVESLDDLLAMEAGR